MGTQVSYKKSVDELPVSMTSAFEWVKLLEEDVDMLCEDTYDNNYK